MPRQSPSRTIPKYRHHKARDLAVVRIGGRDHYLGRYDSPESHAEYRRIVGEWMAHGIAPAAVETIADAPATFTISELMVGYIKHADAYYTKDGKPTSEASLIRLALRVLKRLYGHTPASNFGPMALKTVRQAYIDAGLCRREVNRRTGLVVRFFKWAVENELVPPSVHHGLSAVSGLRKGRTSVRETDPIRPVPDDLVDAVLPHAGGRISAMIALQRLTGMRPGEVIRMRKLDLDTSGDVWVYRPESHKTQHHGRDRVIYIGPQAQLVLKPWLRADQTAYLFSPREAMEENSADRREKRRTPLTPSQRARTRKRKPRKTPGERYTTGSYRWAIAKACDRAGVPSWHPNQLRHNSATRLRREYGLDVARVILGHSSPAVTEVYAEVDQEKARAVMSQVG